MSAHGLVKVDKAWLEEKSVEAHKAWRALEENYRNREQQLYARICLEVKRRCNALLVKYPRIGSDAPLKELLEQGEFREARWKWPIQGRESWGYQLYAKHSFVYLRMDKVNNDYEKSGLNQYGRIDEDVVESVQIPVTHYNAIMWHDSFVESWLQSCEHFLDWTRIEAEMTVAFTNLESAIVESLEEEFDIVEIYEAPTLEQLLADVEEARQGCLRFQAHFPAR